jgi:hypothetical protein
MGISLEPFIGVKIDVDAGVSYDHIVNVPLSEGMGMKLCMNMPIDVGKYMGAVVNECM